MLGLLIYLAGLWMHLVVMSLSNGNVREQIKLKSIKKLKLKKIQRSEYLG